MRIININEDERMALVQALSPLHARIDTGDRGPTGPTDVNAMGDIVLVDPKNVERVIIRFHVPDWCK